jgi:ABC-type dipeptide/oligopeptide/nickel transport system permease subunit
MFVRRALNALAVTLVVLGFLQLAAGVLYWDWGLLPTADRWIYAARPWWPLALLVFVLTCVVMAIIKRQDRLDSRLAELERRQGAFPPESPVSVGSPSSKASSTEFTE